MVCSTVADSVDLAGIVIGSVSVASFTATDVTASLASAALAASMSFASDTIPPLTASNFNVTAYRLLRTGSLVNTGAVIASFPSPCNENCNLLA